MAATRNPAEIDSADQDGRTHADNSVVAEEPHTTASALAANPTGQSLPAYISIGNIEMAHIPALKVLTTSLLPAKYPHSFFTGVVEEPEVATFSRVATHATKPVGWIRCCVNPLPDSSLPLLSTKPLSKQLYIQALCLLAPYRGQGIATALLMAVLDEAALHTYGIGTVLAHVWVANETALAWYEKRGFQKVVLVEQYYRKLRPPGAWMMQKVLR